MNKIHIEKGSIQETLVLPLYAWKLCTEQFPTLYRDEYATKICKSIDYDFSQFKSKGKKCHVPVWCTGRSDAWKR